jgi:hypothetical protein
MKINKLEMIFIKHTPLALLILWSILFLNHLIRGLVVTPLIPVLILTVINYLTWNNKKGV